jgi:hypothetical protein
MIKSNIVKLISVVYWLFSSAIFHLPFSKKASMVWRLGFYLFKNQTTG